MDDAQTDARSVTLSDCSVWRYKPDAHGYDWTCVSVDGTTPDGRRFSFPGLISRRVGKPVEWKDRLTPSDMRLVADVLDPPAALASPRATGSPEPRLWAVFDKNGCPMTEHIYLSDGPAFNAIAFLPMRLPAHAPFTVVPLYDHPSPSLASATAGDWRDSEAVKEARLAVIRAAEEWGGNPHAADTHDALDTLCDIVQSHARHSKA